MTEAQRIGQLFNVGLDKNQLDAASRQAIVANHFGSVWYREKTTIGVAGVRKVADAVQALATKNATAGVKFYVAANQEGGLIQALAGPGFDTIPSAVEQGKLQPAELEAKAATWGQQLRAAGVNMDFAPVADVVPAGTEAQNAPIGQLKREFGSEPLAVAPHVVAFVHGMREAGVATTAKHFPGLGRVEGNTDFTGAVVDTVTTSDDAYLKPFARAVAVHVPFVMMSLATYDLIDADHLAAFSPRLIDQILRRDLGFRGRRDVRQPHREGRCRLDARPAGDRLHPGRWRHDRPGPDRRRRDDGPRGRDASRDRCRVPRPRRSIGAAHPPGKGRGRAAPLLRLTRVVEPTPPGPSLAISLRA